MTTKAPSGHVSMTTRGPVRRTAREIAGSGNVSMTTSALGYLVEV